MKPDLIDRVVSLQTGSALHAVRATRPEFVAGAEECRDAVLEPAVDPGLGLPLRAALAARMARLNANEALANLYREKLDALGSPPDMATIADGGYPETEDARLHAFIRHTDLVTVAPRACTRADIDHLVARGLTVPEVVALAELIGFLNFEVRIVATLDLLKEPG